MSLPIRRRSLAGRAGHDPATFPLTAERSANWATGPGVSSWIRTNITLPMKQVPKPFGHRHWCARRDSNSQPSDYESPAPPLSYTRWCPLMVLPHLPPACKTGALLIELNELVAGEGVAPSTFSLWGWRATTALSRCWNAACTHNTSVKVLTYFWFI